MRVRVKRFFMNLFVLFLALFLFFFVFEVVLRVIHYQDPFENTVYRADPGKGFILSDDPMLVYELAPSTTFAEEGLGKVCVTNSFGFRTGEVSLQKPSDVLRVAVLGDSVAFGVNVDQNESFPERLGILLNSMNLSKKVEVINFGVPGYNTIQEVETFKVKAARFDPDIVILAYTLNDVEDLPSPSPKVVSGRCNIAFLNIGVGCRTKDFLRKSKALKFVKYRVNAFVWSVKLGDYIEGLYKDDSKYKSNVLVPLNELSGLAYKNSGSRPLLVVFPVLTAVGREPYKYDAIHKRVLGDAESLGFITIDLSSSYMVYKQVDIQAVKGDYLHPTPFGHKLAAEKITEKLISQGFLSNVYAKQGFAG